MAPNQRSKDKQMVGVYIERELYDRFSNACQFFNVSITSLITGFIYEKVAEYETERDRGGKLPSPQKPVRKGKGHSEGEK